VVTRIYESSYRRVSAPRPRRPARTNGTQTDYNGKKREESAGSEYRLQTARWYRSLA